MKILIACEFSWVVRDAFAACGHDAWSCDLLETDKPGQHIQGDVLKVLDDGWDLMIAHPPCTYLTIAANGWHKKQPSREAMRQSAFQFFMALYDAPISKVCEWRNNGATACVPLRNP